MGFLDRLLGRPEQPEPSRTAAAPQRTDDEIAVERYRYLLRTAPPETIEQVHTEAFSKLTDEQRDLLFQQLTENAMEGERPANAEPATLAKSATRAELRQPGTMERSMAPRGGAGGMGFGSMMASSLLGTVAGYVIGSALVGAFLPDAGAEGSTDASGEDGGDSGDSGDSGYGSSDASGGDSGGDFGAGDFGGGDMGGFGDFGGGDF